MSPGRYKPKVTRVRIPWWWFVSLALLGIALGFATKNGHTWDALIIASLLLLGIVVVSALIYFQLKQRRSD